MAGPDLQRNGISIYPSSDPDASKGRQLNTLDDLLRWRATRGDQKPVLAYPRSEFGLTDFELFSAWDLNRFTIGAAQQFLGLGLQSVTTNPEAPVVALLGLSTLDYVINMFALSRLGYAVLILSPRLSLDAYQSLLRTTRCQTVVHAPSFESTARKLETEGRLSIIPRSKYDSLSSADDFSMATSTVLASNRVALIVHSSGSTGLPKPIFQRHQACLENFATGYGLRALLTAPFYHVHGLGCLYRTINMRGTLYLYNPNQPLTSANLLAAMNEIQPGVLFCVPYALKLLAESRQGLEALARCEVVSSSGSVCPDDLGNTLAKNGVYLVSLFGSSEFGQVMTSKRPPGDDAWDYMRLFPSAKPYIFMKPIDDSTFELVILDGLKSKNESNSDEPPNSFHSSDIFAPHPTIPDAWKYIGRLDDRVTLVNGEKVLPLPIEGRIRQDPLVREAVVFGTGKDIPGLLVFRSEKARHLSNADFITTIWPSIEDANYHAEAFSQIGRETIIPLDGDVPYPQTDKGTVIRAQVYRKFAGEIEELYRSLDDGQEGGLTLDLDALRAYLLRIFKELIGLPLEDLHSDFFAAGLDSLKVIQAVALIKRDLFLGKHGRKFTQDQVFQRQNVAGLAEFLLRLRQGDASSYPRETDIGLMHSLIKKYSVFTTRVPEDAPVANGHVMLLTGATGSLGSHILAQLGARDDVSTVYCLVRALSTERPLDRVLSALKERSLTLADNEQRKIKALHCDLKRQDLDLPDNIVQQLQVQPTLIIHTAWAVNFNLGVRSFEDQHICGTQNLINFSLAVRRPRPARFVFCSSISTTLGTPRQTPIPEAVIEDLSDVQKTGYAQSKIVTEHIIRNSRLTAGADVCILRVGQIVGDTNLGLWNPSESIPLMISTAEKIGLPELDEQCSWLPVDTVAATTIELAFAGFNPDLDNVSSDTQPLLYNVVHLHPFSWSPDLLDAFKGAGLNFETLSPKVWVKRLQTGDQDPKRNPAVKLSSYWAEKYDRDAEEHWKVSFDTRLAERDSIALRPAPHIIQDGLIAKFVEQWRKEWVTREG